MGRSNSYRDRISSVVVDYDSVSVRGSRGWRARFIGADVALATPTARKLARVLVALSVVAILFCGMFPFDFAFQNGWQAIGNRFDTTLIQQNTAGDSFENILFFLPLGISIGALMRKRWLRAWIGNALVATAIGCALSLLVEVSQCFLGERDPSLTDVVNNTLGTAIGFGIYRAIGPIVMSFIVEWIDRARRSGAAAPLAALATAAWAALVCAAPLVLGGDATSMSSWNPNFPLAIGNEINANRWWEGTVDNVYIASRAVTASEAESLLSTSGDRRKPADVFGATLVASYDLKSGTSPYPDLSAHNSPLEWADKLAAAATSRPAGSLTLETTRPAPSTRSAAIAELLARGPNDYPITSGKFLRTSDGVVAINRAITKSNAFTVMTSLKSNQQNLHGPARIITISGGEGGRNLTIGQEGTALAVRVHMAVTGPIGRNPQFDIDDVFLDNSPKRIIVTFDDSKLRVYVNGTSWRAATRITPESAVVWSMYPRDFWQYHMATDDVAAPSAVYRALAMLPLGMLAAASINLFREWHFRKRLLTVMAIVGGTMVIMEGLLAVSGGNNFQIIPTLIGSIAATVGVLVVKISKRTKPTSGGVISI